MKSEETFFAELEGAFTRRGVKGWELVALASVDSTMNAAAALELVPETRTVIFALEQDAGRGREGRSWTSAPGRGVYATFAFRRSGRAPVAGLSLAAGIAVARAIKTFGAAPLLKWPNDVLAARPDGRLGKIAGILVDLSTSADAQQTLIGIGLNLEPQPLSEAVSLREITGEAVPYAVAAAALTAEVGAVLDTFLAGGFAPLLSEWESYSAVTGRRVVVAEKEGVARGVGADGALLLEIAGATERIYNGSLVFLDE